MGFQNKIDEIRNKPEHIRVRYVWFSVAVSMLFVVIIWMFSIQSGIKPIEVDEEGASNIQKQLQGIKDNAPSIDELLDTAKNAKETLNAPEVQGDYQQKEEQMETPQEQTANQKENTLPENKLPNNNELNKPEINGEKPPFPPKEQ